MPGGGERWEPTLVKKTVETYECDICGADGERYTINFPEGLLALDRCGRHDRKVLALRNEKGSWVQTPGSRASFRISTLEDIERQRRAKKK